MRNFVIALILAAALLLTYSLSRRTRSADTASSDGQVRQVQVLTLEEREQQRRQKLEESALTYKQAGEIKEAVRLWKELADKYSQEPQGARALYELQFYYTHNKRPIQAENAFRQLLQHHPQSEFVPQALFERATQLEQRKQMTQALEIYRQIIADYFFFEQVEEVQKRMEAIERARLFSKTASPDTEFYTVQAGDSLYVIAKKFNTTVDYIMRANHLSSSRVIHPGDQLKVLKPETTVAVNVDKSQRVLTLKVNGRIVRHYPVAIGVDDATPVGQFAIQNKLKDPVWFKAGAPIPPDDPRNILGSRWLGFERDLGIHGSTETKDILEQTSNGCIRMTNSDVEELYSLLRVGDTVQIVE